MSKHAALFDGLEEAVGFALSAGAIERACEKAVDAVTRLGDVPLARLEGHLWGLAQAEADPLVKLALEQAAHIAMCEREDAAIAAAEGSMR